jgi:DNA invertase Pin-like site-specific DNA recombinase
MTVRVALYLRVSTRDQRLTQQFRDLVSAVHARGWTVARVFRERRSGTSGVDRPQWRKLLHEAQLRRFGGVAAVSIDRLGRSALDVLRAVEGFRSRGTKLLLVREGLTTEDAAGQLLITVLAGVAQLERDMIADRTRAGIRGARARGAVIGRPVETIAGSDLQKVRDGDLTQAQLARLLQVSVRTIRRRLRTETPPLPPSKRSRQTGTDRALSG